MRNLKFRQIIWSSSVIIVLVACKQRKLDESTTTAYGNDRIHLVVAAPAEGEAADNSPFQQRLWICRGTEVAAGSAPKGYEVSIGIGEDESGTDPSVPVDKRNENNSHLTPVGIFEIGAMIGSGKAWTSCDGTPADIKPYLGMTHRCMQLRGLERGINDNAVARGIFIHGTPERNYDDLGASASHGCVRMHNSDVLSVYNYTLKDSRGNRLDGVNTGTRVYISQLDARYTSGQHACTFAGTTGRQSEGEIRSGCMSPNLSRFEKDGHQILVLHDAPAMTPAAIVDATSARKDGYPYKIYLKHSNQDKSNMAFKAEANGQKIVGIRYNMNWNPSGKIPFEATWNCDRWVGMFKHGEILEIKN